MTGRDAEQQCKFGWHFLLVPRKIDPARANRPSRASDAATQQPANGAEHASPLPEHLRENVAIAEKGALPADVYAEAKKRLDEAGERPE